MGAASKYPDETFYLSHVFNDTTNSYKFVWFLALLSRLSEDCRLTHLMSDIFIDMVVAAWHPVCLYRLSLGRQDKLQFFVEKVSGASGLPPNASRDIIRKHVKESKETLDSLNYFGRYVPTRFLNPWFAERLRGENNDINRTRNIQDWAKQCQGNLSASIYYFEDTPKGPAIKINERWLTFLSENYGLIYSFAEYNFALYLQSRNPNVPGVIKKLHAPNSRQLTAAREFWRLVKTDLSNSGNSKEFVDIYTKHNLDNNFSIDHFLPWSFVVHDLIWNLAPVEITTNSSKSDQLPDLDVYVPRLANLHHHAILVAKKRPRFLEDYADCFKKDPRELINLSPIELTSKYFEILIPQAQIARNQGFQFGWKL